MKFTGDMCITVCMQGQSDRVISVLKEILVDRCRRNPSYSLRAMASSLSMSPSHFSQVLNGKRGLSAKTLHKICDRLGLDLEFQNDFKSISESLYGEIAEWHTYALLSLIDTDDFQPDIKWIASRLKIPYSIAKHTVEKLRELNVLDTSESRWKQLISQIKVDTKSSTAKAREFQKSNISKAVETIENEPFENRDITSCTMAIDPSLIPEIRERISKFRLDMIRDIEAKSKNKKEVYNLNVQFFPLTKVRKI